MRYVLPKPLLYTKDNYKYARLHNELKEQLDAPYRVYTTITWMAIGSGRSMCSILDRRIRQTGLPVIRFEGALPSGELKFDKPKLHILIKLLQVDYFRVGRTNTRNRFVGQDKCYIYAKRRSEETGKYHICLEIEMKGDLQDENTFFVYGQAERLPSRRRSTELTSTVIPTTH